MASFLVLVLASSVSSAMANLTHQSDDKLANGNSPFDKLNTWEELTKKDKMLFKSLLHHADDFKIKDPKFTLSEEGNIASVFLSNLHAYNSDKQYQCNFPARALFFSELLNRPTKDISSCENLNEYLQAVPKDKISLVYASENLLSPSSFMGHAFLKLSDSNDNKAFAISFYTDVNTYNLPKLFFEALATGKKGFFIVSPFSQSQYFYNEEENRELYEYELELTETQKQFIRLHLWELKDKEIDYLFHTHNCATISLDILSIAQPALLSDSNDWVSPLDVVKRTNEVNLHGMTTVSPSTNWKAIVYGDSLDSQTKQQVLDRIQSPEELKSLLNSRADEESFLVYEYVQALNTKLYHDKRIEESSYLENLNLFESMADKYDGYILDLSQYKKPQNRPDESHFSVGFRTLDGKTQDYIVSWMPVSHKLTDDNRHALSESALEIMNFSFLINEETILLERLDLYKIATYIPYDPLINNYSGRFSLAYDAKYRLHSRNHDFITIDGQIGYSKKWVKDSLLYLTTGPKISFNDSRFIASPSIESGLFTYIQDTKFHLKSTLNWNEFGRNKFNNTIELDVSYFPHPNHVVNFKAMNHNHNFSSDHQEIYVGYSYLY